MKLQWRNLLLVLLGLWLVLLIYMSTTLYQTSDLKADPTQQQLINALLELDQLEAENKKLFSLAKQLQKELLLEKHSKAKAALGASMITKRQESNGKDAGFILDETLSDFMAPSVSHEIIRRDVIYGVNEQWYYISSQLRKIKQTLIKKDAEKSVIESLDDVLLTGADYRRALLRDLNNLTNLALDWRKKESEELSQIIQERIHKTQNPDNCATARKLVCNLNKGCGFGCQLHHLVYCFLIAHGTGRTLIIDSRAWRYSSGGWEKYFLPVSETCTDWSGESNAPWGPNVEHVQVVTLPIVDSLRPRSPYMPQAIPVDLADRLIRLHGHPFVWFVGQFVQYLMRPQPALANDIEEVSLSLNFQNPIVGIHIRRTDKLQAEAAYHGIDEYMTYVEEYYDLLDAQLKMAAGPRDSLSPYKPVKRRVYIASDDPTVIDEAKLGYSHYEVISDPSFSKSAGLSSRYTDTSLRAVILDIYFLSRSDYLVCTFSSQVCRVAYEIMQTLHADASSYFKSLDDIYYFGGQNGHHQVVISDHKPRRGSEEIELMMGDFVGIAGNHWDGFSKGVNKRTGRAGVYPSYKVRENIQLANYPTFSLTVANSSLIKNNNKADYYNRR